MLRTNLLSGAACLMVSGLAAACLPAMALAQSDDQGAKDSDFILEEIVVTAQKRVQNLQDVPISVSVVTGDLMRDAQITTVTDLGNRISGVKVNRAGASDSLNIRGIGSGFNMGFEQSVATFIDGVYISRSQTTRVGFLDLERMEVLKGPQSTYFGSNAIAGALSAVTRKPSQTPNGQASALYGFSDGEYDVQAAVGQPLTDRLSGRIALRKSGMDGYIRNVRMDQDGPNNNDTQARLSLRYEADDLDINWRVDYADFDNKRAEFQEILNCPPAPGYGSPGVGCLSVISAGNADNRLDYRTSTGDSFFKLDSVSSALNIAWTVGSHTLTSTTGYYEHDIHRFTDSPLLPVAGLTGITKSSGLPITQLEKFHSFSQEIRLESDKGGFLEYMLGVYYDKSNLEGSLSYGFYFAPFWARLGGAVAPNTPLAQRAAGDQDQSNRSVFAAGTLNVADDFRINLGARYSSVEKKNHRETHVGVGDNFGRFSAGSEVSAAAFAAFTGSVGFPAGDYAITKRTDDKFMPSINLQYDLTRDAMVYGSYTTGFKAGGWAIGNSKDFFGPETVKSYEGGVKAAWFGRRLTTNVAAFNSRYNGLQESTSIANAAGVPVSVIANVGRARVRGIDLEVGVHAPSGLSLSANVGYLDAEYLEYPNAPCTQLQLLAKPTGCTQNLAGKTKAFAPEWSGGVNASYGFDLTADIRGQLGAWLYFTSGYYQQASIDPLFYQPGNAKLDLRATIGAVDDRWEVAVIGKNVTDKVTAGYRSVMTASNAVTAATDRSRSVAVQVSTKF
ncbi:TonB-dependent receptor [Niveispirillum sp.]|uniref:TonB-dependent receptor n=1 Tax=Niveispirillum sp. TaxID=1917217 RepID=UPI001B6C3B5D|nr:TonB-dependent receptor [Niveispirillum sp.]MBP7340404.1 TonB-dependent receptor [Niveispirillum sp.]